MYKDCFLKIALMIFVCSMLCSCNRYEYIKSSDGSSVRKLDSQEITEMCYQGVVYVRFGSPEFSWGSVKYTPEGKIVTCVPEIKSSIKK